MEPDADLPLYLRRFRERAGSGQGQAAASALLEVDGERFTPEFAGTSRDKEIVARGPGLDGRLAVHQRGHSLSKSVRPGQKVRIVCADTSRARQTADQIYRGMNDGLQQWGRQAEIGAPEAIPELRNFQVWTPEGPARRHLGVPPVPGADGEAAERMENTG